MSSKKQQYIITIGSLVALLLALVAGFVINYYDLETSPFSLQMIDFIGKIWIFLLVLLVVPLACSYLLSAVLSLTDNKDLGRLGIRAIRVHLIILLSAVGFTTLAGISILELLGDQLPHLNISDAQKVAQNTTKEEALQWFGQLKSHVVSIQQLIGRSILIAMLLSGLVGIIVAYYGGASRAQWASVSKLVANKSIAWLFIYLTTLPLAVFTLMFRMTLDSGGAVFGVAAYFVVILSTLLLMFTFILYVLPQLWTRTSFIDYFKGMLQVQLVAMSSRSSLATTPSLMLAAERNFQVAKEASAVIIPFFVTIFRMNKGISSIFNYIFLIYVYNLELSVLTFAGFIALQLLTSFSTPGIPSAGKFTSLPIYLAAGVPLEGLILLKAVDAIPDIFKTMVNVTEVMTVTLLVRNKIPQPA